MMLQVSGDGNVEILLLTYNNSGSLADDGRCCDREPFCDVCENYFDICYREGTSTRSPSPLCNSRVVTQTRFGDNVNFASGPSVFGDGIGNPLRFPFDRTWTVNQIVEHKLLHCLFNCKKLEQLIAPQ